MTFFTFILANKVTILGALLACSEVLALIPSIKHNSIFEIIVTTLNKLVPPKE